MKALPLEYFFKLERKQNGSDTLMATEVFVMKEKLPNTEQTRELSMNTALNPDFSMGLPPESENPYAAVTYVPGHSAADHHMVEAGNEFIAAKEIGQQNNNG
jgi:hypothetical protein